MQLYLTILPFFISIDEIVLDSLGALTASVRLYSSFRCVIYLKGVNIHIYISGNVYNNFC